MGTVQGEVRTTTTAVRGVLVEIFDVPEHFQRCLPLVDRSSIAQQSLRRLGSALTDDAGQFVLEYDPPTSTGLWLARKRPVNLWLSVSAFGADKTLRLVHAEADVRRLAGELETYTVCLADDVVPPAAVFDTPAAIPTPDAIRRKEAAREAVTQELQKSEVKAVAARAARRQDFRTKVAPTLLTELSSVERDETDAPVDPDYIDAEGAVRKHAEARMVQAIDRSFKVNAAVPLRLTGRLSLTPQQMVAIESAGVIDGDTVTVGEATLAAMLAEGGDGTNPEVGQAILSRVDALGSFCRDPNAAEQCLEPEGQNGDGQGGVENGSEEPVPISQPQPSDGLDHVGAGIASETLVDKIPTYVAAILDEDTNGALPAPGDQLSEQEVLDAPSFPSLTLPPGPADVPAFFDFHDLQIAFKPVWSEVLDESLLEDAEAAYERYVELGGDPTHIFTPPLAVPGFASLTAWSSFTSVISAAVGTAANKPPPQVTRYIAVTAEEWATLTGAHQKELRAIAADIDDLYALIHGNTTDKHDYIDNVGKKDLDNFERTLRYIQAKTAEYTEQADRIVQFARSEIDRRANARSPVPSHRVLTALQTRARSQYPTTFFAANRKGRSVNFGLLVTYRQRWTPTSYQVGELIKSIPLAPKEVRKYSKKIMRNETRSRKELESNVESQKSDTMSTSRGEAEIVQKAMEKTNFNATASGGFKIGIADVSGSSALTQDAENRSAQTKKSFHEAVVKAAREYKNELKVELESASTFETEFQESGELVNPNDEIAVTYLFYELQRRYQVTERLHRLRSVILVAQEMPAPREIDEDWIIAHRWILNRVLLDDSFRVPLSYVAEGLVADEHALTEMRKSLAQQRNLVEELKEDVTESRSLTESRYAALQRSMERAARAAQSKDGGIFGFAKKLTSLTAVGSFADRLFGSDDESPETARIREAATRDAYERELERLRDLEGRIAAANNSLVYATEEYTERVSAHLANVVLVNELKNHIQDNIVYYMQAVWLHEPEHMRWLRLKDVPVPVLKRGPRSFQITRAPIAGSLAKVPHRFVGVHGYETTADVDPIPPGGELPTVPLYEVADLDRLLGFRANYMVFEMKNPNALTDFMMEPFVERAAAGMGITDPDDLGNMTLEEFSDYVCCLKERLSEEEFGQLRDELNAQLKRLLQSPLRDDEEIVVPLDAMYIEALPSHRPVLENFKLLHRQIDAADAHEDLRLKKLEKIRYAKRILRDELDDPEADARYVFDGHPPGLSTPQPLPGETWEN